MQSLLLMWSHSTLNHIYIWQHHPDLTNMRQFVIWEIWGTCEKKVRDQEKGFHAGVLLWFLAWCNFWNKFCFLWFAVTWKAPEGKASGCPSLFCGEQDWSKLSIVPFHLLHQVPLPAVNCIGLHMLISLKGVTLVSHFNFTTTKTKLRKFTLIDTIIWFMLIHLCRSCAGNMYLN